MKISTFNIQGLLLLEPRFFTDDRGCFFQSWHRNDYLNAGIKQDFVQDNVSYSKKGVLRGLHLQNPNSQGKLVSVLYGEVFDVAVDVRAGSPTFGLWQSVILNAENKHQFFVPPGFAHGFCVLSELAVFHYKCTDYYSKNDEMGLIWNDPDLAIDWPVSTPLVSDKDAILPRLKDIPKSKLIFS